AALKRWGGYLLMAVGTLLVLGVLFVFSRTVENSAKYGRWQNEILIVSVIGVVVLSALLVRRIYVLVRDYRAHVPGSRLAVRTVGIFGTLSVVPLLVVSLFSLSFTDRGSDSWFTKNIGRELTAAIDQSRLALEQRQHEEERRTIELAGTLVDHSDASLATVLDAERRAAGARDLIVFDRRGQVLAASADGDDALSLDQLPRELLE